MKKLNVRDTHKYGKGVFANSVFEKGEVIYILAGERIDVSLLADKVLSSSLLIDDPLQFGRRTFCELDDFSRTFNHSCDPVAGIRRNLELFALRKIQKGEEITYDYSLTIAPTKWAMNCKCGSEICRKIIGDILSVPIMRREEYRKVGALQNYMKKLLLEIEKGNYKTPIYEFRFLERIGQFDRCRDHSADLL